MKKIHVIIMSSLFVFTSVANAQWTIGAGIPLNYEARTESELQSSLNQMTQYSETKSDADSGHYIYAEHNWGSPELTLTFRLAHHYIDLSDEDFSDGRMNSLSYGVLYRANEKVKLATLIGLGSVTLEDSDKLRAFREEISTAVELNAEASYYMTAKASVKIGYKFVRFHRRYSFESTTIKAQIISTEEIKGFNVGLRYDF